MLRVKTFDKGFQLYFKDHMILEHSIKSPAIGIGIGEASYSMKHGSFKINNRTRETIKTYDFQIAQQDPQKVCIDFNERLTATFEILHERLEIHFSCVDPKVNRLWLHLCSSVHEHIYGCGEQYSKLDLKGDRVPIWCEEQGIGRGKDLLTFLAELTHGAGGNAFTTYYPQPTFVSSSNFYCHVEHSGYMIFDFSKAAVSEIYCFGIPQKVVIDKSNTMIEALRSLTDYLGRQPALPEWTYAGAWLGIQGGRSIVEQKLDNARKAGVKLAALWCQDWEGIRITSFGKQLMWDWKYDSNLYPELPQYIEQLQEAGIRFVGYINPFLALEGTLYQEASQKGYLVKTLLGEEYHVYITTFPAAILDLSNPEAVRWIKTVIKDNMLGIGLSGWMADFGEYLPTDCLLYSCEDPETFHNKYPVLWAKANQEAVEESGRQDEVVFFNRAGYSGSSRHCPLFWAGDQLVNWSKDDGLPSVIPAGISLGMSGVGFYHSDIGGYTTVAWLKRSKELFMRWTEHSAFTIVMRTHEGNRPAINWQFDSDDETLSHFAKMSRVHAGLKDYFKHLVSEYQNTGLPLIRHPFIHYEGDKVLHTLKYQYLLGRDLLVAPVIKPGKKTWRVYLPEDNWLHLWSGKEYGGGWHQLNCPLGQPPVFYRAASEFAAVFESLKRL